MASEQGVVAHGFVPSTRDQSSMNLTGEKIQHWWPLVMSAEGQGARATRRLERASRENTDCAGEREEKPQNKSRLLNLFLKAYINKTNI